MLKTLIIGALIVVFVIMFVFLIRKIFVGIVIFLLIFGVVFYGLNKYDIGVRDIVDISDLYEKADKLNSLVKFNKDEKELTIKGEEFELFVKKDIESGEYLLNGEAPVGSEVGVRAMMKMIDMTNKTLKVDTVWNDIKKYNKEDDNLTEVVNESLNNVSGNLTDIIANPQQVTNLLNHLESSGDVLVLGNLNLKIESEKLKVSKNLSKGN